MSRLRRLRALAALSTVVLAGLLAASLAHAESDPAAQPVFRLRWGSFGAGPGQFGGPIGSAVSLSGDLYVADAGNDRIQQFDPHGELIRMWGTEGEDAGEFYALRDIDIDSDGNVYALDGDRVQKFTAEGTFVTEWGEFAPAPGPGQFRQAFGIAVDRADDSVYTIDRPPSAGGRVQRFASDGSFVDSWNAGVTDEGTLGPLAAGDGVVYAATSATIWKYSNAGTELDTYCSSCGPPAVGFGNIRDLALDQYGNLYTAESTAEVVQKLSPDGDPLYAIESAEAGPGGFIVPRSVSAGPHGRVYTTEGGPDRVKLFSPAAPFTDVPPWVGEQVGWLAYHDYVSGYPNGTFRADNPISRAEKARMLYRIAGEPDVTGLEHALSDVPEWVDPAVKWLVGNDFMTGFDDDTFRPKEPITRAQEARVLYRIAGEPDVTDLPEHGLSDVPEWVEPAVTWLVANGHMTGYPNSTFRPDLPITRGQEANVAFNVYA